jgi:hypothetical protein
MGMSVSCGCAVDVVQESYAECRSDAVLAVTPCAISPRGLAL